MDNLETRYTETIVRALGENKIAGTASVTYNGTAGSEYNLFGTTYERVAPGAFDNVLRTNPDVMALHGHDTKQPLGRTSNGTLAIRADGNGLHYEVQLNPNVSYAKDLYHNIDSGIVRGSSFKANIGYAEWSKEGNREIRTIRRFATLVDVSPTMLPAYSGSNVLVRSVEIDAIKREQDNWYTLLENAARCERAKALLDALKINNRHSI